MGNPVCSSKYILLCVYIRNDGDGDDDDREKRWR